MKRWQDRGEVEDSDEDEELSLGNESQSPQRSGKWPRLEGETDKNGGQAGNSDVEKGEEESTPVRTNERFPEQNGQETEESWLQPRNATTYSRRVRAVQVGLPREALAARPDEKSDVSLASPAHSPEAENAKADHQDLGGAHIRSPRSENEDERNAVNSRAVTSLMFQGSRGNAGNLSRNPSLGDRAQDPSRNLRAYSEDAARETQQLQVEGFTQDANLSGKPLSHLSGSLPSVSQILERNRENTPAKQNEIRSASSSPLSEREVSPPPGFVLPLADRATSILASQHPDSGGRLGINADDVVDDMELAQALQHPETAIAARRSLRTRKEKQLHPYEYEKAIYQRQMRQRGYKPIRFAEHDERNRQDTQDRPYSEDESASQLQEAGQSSSPAQPSSQPLAHDVSQRIEDQMATNSDDELPHIDAIISRRGRDTARHGHKRRKLAHKTTRRHQVQYQHDEYSIPPSPPPTSSDSHHREKPVFRLPHSRLPGSLPTPDVSSEVRPSHRDATGANSQSDEDWPGTSHTPARTRLLRRSQAVDISSDSDQSSESDGEEQSEEDPRRFTKERKRIRGVLPASWLKIDFKAQQKREIPSLEKPHRSASTSPPPSNRPQKGVAQRVAPTSTVSARRGPIVISDNEEDSDVEGIPAAELQDQRSNPIIDHHSRGEDTAAGFEPMEVDWVDPMLANPSRREQISRSGKKRQPRIKDAFTKSGSTRNGFTEERADFGRLGRKSQKQQSAVASKPNRRHRSSALSLSILDAPSTPSAKDRPLPQFMRLAKRQASRQPNHARHSPNAKFIRLATDEDTEAASVTLHAWKEGKIVPRTQLNNISLPVGESPSDVIDDDSEHAQKAIQDSRLPLNLLDPNQRAPLPDSPSKKRLQHKVMSRRPIHVQKTGLRQARLQAIVRPGPRQSDNRNAGDFPETLDGERLTRPQRRQRPPIPGPHVRSAQLETEANDFAQEHCVAAFERQVNYFTATTAARIDPLSKRNVQLERFLEPTPDPNTSIRRPKEAENARGSGINLSNSRDGKQKLAFRQRKRQAHQINTESRRYRQPSEPLPEPVAATDDANDLQLHNAPILKGLRPFGTKYAMDFDIHPVPLGTYFHENTFIGSGDFAAALRTYQRGLTVRTGRMRIYVNEDVLEWGDWTEEVASGLASIPSAMDEAISTLDGITSDLERQEQTSLVTSNVDHMLRSVVRYLSKCLVLLDPIDRRSCVQQLQRLVEEICELTLAETRSSNACAGLNLRCICYATAIATQLVQISGDEVIPPEMRRQSQQLLGQAAKRLAASIIPHGLVDLREACEELQQASKRETGIQEDIGPISRLVVLRYCLESAGQPDLSFWSLVNKEIANDLIDTEDVLSMERAWYNIFTVLPILSIDETGLAHPRSQLRSCPQDWTLVCRMMKQTLSLYPSTVSLRGSTINDYVRAVLTRCYILVRRWGWWRCESVLGITYDFFAGRGLAQLDHEQSFGSPRFLEELPCRPSVELEQGDTAFHIFLKTIVSSLHGMRKAGIYNDRKIGGVAWRFIPNHGRVYRRDADVNQTDLDALRNHLDLLCTLYYATPPGQRLRLALVRDLVDHATSHREACRLSVRAWTNLASFQASTDESQESLSAFVDWYQRILRTTMSQFRLAKTEAENDFAVAIGQGAVGLTTHDLTATVAANQRHIAATLVDALAGLKRTLVASKNLQTAAFLIDTCQFWSVLSPFDPNERRLLPALDEALNILRVALEWHCKSKVGAQSQQSSEESQDYGDSEALEEVAATDAANASDKRDIIELLDSPLSSLLSNVVGAEQPVDESLLTKLVSLWAQFASESVQGGQRTWSSYLDGYSSYSWYQLRETEHRRKLTPHFLALVVGNEGASGHEMQTAVLRSWVVSLVEREASLKHQHLLTAALLNHLHGEPLLENLPFSRDSRTRRFSLSLHDFRQRRLSLISSILSNMRQHYHATRSFQPGDHREVRQSYVQLLKDLMNAMKNNYLELQSSSDTSIASIANPTATGNYVEFVQHVISFLQQYTSDICRVDSFFTDSSAFPLPASDPTYVVGRLKSYQPRLADSKARKQLATFVLAVSERAVVDCQQKYLVDQLCSAMDGAYERGDRGTPVLSHVLLTAIFPAFLRSALSSPCAWMLALPVLQATYYALGELFFYIQMENAASVETYLGILGAALSSLQQPLVAVFDNPGLLRLSHVHAVLVQVFECSRVPLTAIDFLSRIGSDVSSVRLELDAIRSRGSEIHAYLSGSQRHLRDPVDHVPPRHVQWKDTVDFSQYELEHALKERWQASEGGYQVRWGSTIREVVVPLGDEEEESEGLLASIERYDGAFEAIVQGLSRMRVVTRPESCSLGAVMV
ncbi:hypothetical protein KC340_g12129 [Hortaea werneckii]|nr:hypothetical protein KC342_g12512 [Hortaea werneckii]KAI7304792.1 hypothetical protein KC340_g12129 [Hortaea werneckii]KAI7391505.1 hypothetical protein KC328_g7467 [Hortaea werneckii]